MEDRMIIWKQQRGGIAKPVTSVDSLDNGIFVIEAMLKEWRASKKGRKAKRDGTDGHIYYSDGKLAGMCWLDPPPIREPVKPA